MNNMWTRTRTMAFTAVGVVAALASGCASNEQTWITYDCEGDAVRVSLSAEQAEIESVLFSGTLPRIEAGSGMKYAADDKLFWSHAGHDGLAEFDGKQRLCLSAGDGIYSYGLFWE